jgi:proteasome lid subunit RPN8/RPN11
METNSDLTTGKWTCPECPFVIEYSERVLDDIRLAVTDAFFSLPRGGAEIGGVLLGRHENGCIVIDESVQLNCEHAFGPSFVLSAHDFAALEGLLAAAKKNPGSEPVGWWHSHTRTEIFLSEADQEIHHRFFPEPWQVALVLKPHTFQPTRAGFFFREKGGAIHAAGTYREFQIEAKPLRAVPSPAAPPPAVAGFTRMREADSSGPVVNVFPTSAPAEAGPAGRGGDAPSPVMNVAPTVTPAEAGGTVLPVERPSPVINVAPELAAETAGSRKVGPPAQANSVVSEASPLTASPRTGEVSPQVGNAVPQPAPALSGRSARNAEPAARVNNVPDGAAPAVTASPRKLETPAQVTESPAPGINAVSEAASVGSSAPPRKMEGAAQATNVAPEAMPSASSVGPREAEPSRPVIDIVPATTSEPQRPAPPDRPAEAPARPETPPPDFLGAEPARSRHWIAWAAVVIGLAVGVGGYESRASWLPAIGSAPPPVPLALSVVDQDGQLQIRWNGSSPTAQGASAGTLVIADGATPLSIPLDAAHLHSGSFTYARTGDRVDVTLIVPQPAGGEAREATTFASTVPRHRPTTAGDSALRAERDRLAAENERLKADYGRQVERARTLEKGFEELRKAVQRQQQRKRLEVQSPDTAK